MEEPFFGKDDPVRLQRMGPTAVTYFLGDRFHFRSALISFRRIWMCSESSHWKDIVEYLMEPHLPSQVANTARHYQGAITSETQKDGFPAKVNVVRIIDLWLNTVAFSGVSIFGRCFILPLLEILQRPPRKFWLQFHVGAHGLPRG